MAIDLEIKDNHLHFDGINLFRGNANNVQLGSVGGKKTRPRRRITCRSKQTSR